MLQTWDQVDEIKYNGSDHGNDSGDANRSTEGVARIPGRAVQLGSRRRRLAPTRKCRCSPITRKIGFT
jgi:hypothetical protein